MSSEKPPILMWNHRLHEEWGKERLFFWRLAFSPTYDRAKIIRRLEAALTGSQILSYGLYESTGQHDLFLRAWIPSSLSQDAFEDTLYNQLSKEHLQICEAFAVTDVRAHWVWKPATGQSPALGDDEPEVLVPTNEAINRRLSDRDIQRANRNELTDAEVEQFESAHLLRRWTPTPGIRIIVLIPRSPHSLPRIARRSLGSELRRILTSNGSLYDISIYEGSGFAQFLMMATVAPHEFAQINEAIDAINSVGLQQYFAVRTFTHIIVNSAGRQLPLHDELPLAKEVHEVDAVESYLERDESDDLEFKSTAFVSVGAWLETGKASHSDDVLDSALKTIVGFLNAGGGTLVVGVLESKQFSGHPSRGKLEVFPQFAKYLISGIELDTIGHDADWFQLRLSDLLRSRITPLCTNWLSVKLFPFSGRTICVIPVRRVISDDWFYLNGRDQKGKPDKDDPLRFFVRQGNSTRQLSGPEADEYKRTNPR